MLTVILDSGAFSAWMRQTDVSLGAYLDYARDLHRAEVVVNLDVIPGAFGKPPTAEQVEASAQQGWENMEAIEACGMTPMPVFHQGERFEWLFKMILTGHNYIGISPDNSMPIKAKQAWLDTVFTYITDADGWPVIRTHGFGVGSYSLMMRYPWYSCDSSNWVFSTSRGSMTIPHFLPSGEIDWRRAPTKIAVSAKAGPALIEGKHFQNLSQHERDIITTYVEAQGIPMQRMYDSAYARQALAILLFKQFSDHYEIQPFRHKQPMFFSESHDLGPRVKIERLRVFFVEGQLVRAQSCLLRRARVMNRLVSYWYVQDICPEQICEYIETDGQMFKGFNYDDDIEQYFAKTGFLEGGRDAKIRA